MMVPLEGMDDGVDVGGMTGAGDDTLASFRARETRCRAVRGGCGDSSRVVRGDLVHRRRRCWSGVGRR